MKNRIINKIIFIFLFIIIQSTNIVYAIETKTNFSKRVMAKKYLLAMFFVGLFFIVITLGLTIYNKIFVKNNRDLSNTNECLNTPSDKDNALKMYLENNKIK